MQDLIQRKRMGEALSRGDIARLVQGIQDGSCSGEQLGALVVLLHQQGLNPEETLHLTAELGRAGTVLPAPRPGVVRLDKHSTGGVGDKVSIALAPLLAACGAEVPMISTRGLLHSGGTLDKMESIPGFKVDLPIARMQELLSDVGMFICNSSGDLLPAERRLFAAKHLTGLVDSLPLIVANILARKLAEGLTGLVLDVKVGRGAFIQDRARASELARLLVGTASALGLRAVALVTAMEEPLGRTVGNALEVREVIDLLKGSGPADLRSVVLSLGAEALILGGLALDIAAGRKMLEDCVTSGRALDRFRAMVAAQGGNPGVVDRPTLLPRAPVVLTGKAPHEGYIADIQALDIGLAAVELGAGRRDWCDPVDPATGIVLLKKVGEVVASDEPLFEVHARTSEVAALVRDMVLEAFTLSMEGVTHDRLVLGRLEGRL